MYPHISFFDFDEKERKMKWGRESIEKFPSYLCEVKLSK